MFKYIVDGEWCEGDGQTLRQFAPTMLKHKGVFETLRTYQGQPFLLEQHIQRAQKGLAVLGLSLPDKAVALMQQTQSVVDDSRRKNVRLRLSFWQQNKEMRYAITATPLKPLSVQDYRFGYQVMFVRRQREESNVMAEVKSLDYGDYMSAYQRAKVRHCDEALLVNQAGHVYEGSRTNLFIVTDDHIITPSLSSGCLNGITRQHVIALINKAGFSLQQNILDKQDVLKADEIFVTNSTLEIMPVTMVEKAEKSVGSVTQALMKAYKSTLPT